MPRPQNKPHVTCGAKANNGPCKASAMPNGKCYHHGGATVGGGAPTNNSNARKHGLFDSSLGDVGRKVYDEASEMGPDVVARQAANFAVAKIAEAYSTAEVKGVARLVEEYLDGLVEDKACSPKVRDILVRRLAEPDIASLGKALGPLKGLLETKAPSDARDGDDVLSGLVDALQRSRDNA